MPLSVDELLKPRYKVIADYPNASFKVGSVWETDIAVHYAQMSDELDFDKYPHLFQKLHWAEERELGELPEYVKFNNQFCYKVIEWGRLGAAKCWDEINQEETRILFIMNLVAPITKQEYDLHQSTIAQ